MTAARVRRASSRCASDQRSRSGGRAAIDDWPLDEDGFELLAPGLKRAYARGRKRFRQARRAIRATRPCTSGASARRTSGTSCGSSAAAWPELIEATADEAHELADRLGDDHDLVVLGAYLDESATIR